MPRGRKKAAEDGSSSQSGNGQTGGRRVNKMDCVRQAMERLGDDAAPKDIQGFLETEFQLHMDTKMISTYKGSILKKRREGQGGLMRAAAGRGRPAGIATASRGGDIAVEEIRAVKELGDRIGADKVRAIMDVLYE